MNGKNKSVKLAYWFHVALSAFLLAKPNAHDIKWVWLFQVNLHTPSRDHVYNSACTKLTESRPLIIQLPVQKIPGQSCTKPVCEFNQTLIFSRLSVVKEKKESGTHARLLSSEGQHFDVYT